MNENDIKLAYQAYLKNTIDVKCGKLRIREHADEILTLYELVNADNEHVIGMYEKIIDLGDDGFICIHSKNGSKCLIHFSVTGDEISSSDLYSEVELHDEYFRAYSSNAHSNGEFYDYELGSFLIPDMMGDMNISYDRKSPIILIRNTKDGKVSYKFYKKNSVDYSLATKEGYDFATPFYNGIATVKKDGVYYAIDVDENNVFNKFFCYLGSFEEGVAPFSYDGKKFGYINANGEIIVEPKYKEACEFRNGIATVKEASLFKKSSSCIDLTGAFIQVVSHPDYDMILENGYYNFFDKYNDRYVSIKYRVVKDFPKFTLCESPSGLTYFDKDTGKYVALANGLVKYELHDRLLIVGGTQYYICSNGNVVDLGNSLDMTDVVSLGDFIGDNKSLLSYDAFKEQKAYSDESIAYIKDKALEVELEETKQDNSGFSGIPETFNSDGNADNYNVHEIVSKRRKTIDDEKSEISKQLNELRKKLELLDKMGHSEIRISSEEFFDVYEDHKEIKPELLDDLPFLELSNMCFDDVKVSGVNFSGSNVVINPQTVYKKDMSNGIYDGIRFSNNDFTGVNTDNSSFKDCDVPFSVYEIAEILDIEETGVKKM